MKNESQKLLWFGATMTGPVRGIRSAPVIRSRKYRRMNGTTIAHRSAYSGRETPRSRARRCASSWVIASERSDVPPAGSPSGVPLLCRRRLEELDRVAGGILEQDLPAARPADDLVAKRQPRGP